MYTVLAGYLATFHYLVRIPDSQETGYIYLVVISTKNSTLNNSQSRAMSLIQTMTSQVQTRNLLTPSTQQSGSPNQTNTVSKLLNAHSDSIVN